MSEFKEVFDVGGDPVGLFIEDGRVFLAVPVGLDVGSTVGLYVPSDLVRLQDIEIDRKSRPFYLIEWTGDFDDAVRRSIDRLAALRWSLPGMRQLPLVIEREPEIET